MTQISSNLTNVLDSNPALNMQQREKSYEEFATQGYPILKIKNSILTI